MAIDINFTDLIELKAKNKRIGNITKGLTNGILYTSLFTMILSGIIGIDFFVQLGLCKATKKTIKKFL